MPKEDISPYPEMPVIFDNRGRVPYDPKKMQRETFAERKMCSSGYVSMCPRPSALRGCR
jgi:hypothetical protein